MHQGLRGGDVAVSLSADIGPARRPDLWPDVDLTSSM
jgi:hypothetical protein